MEESTIAPHYEGLSKEGSSRVANAGLDLFFEMEVEALHTVEEHLRALERLRSLCEVVIGRTGT